MTQLNTSLSRNETLGLLSLSFACLAVIANTFHGDGEPLIASLAFSGIAYAASFAMVRWLGPTLIKAGLSGKDLGRKEKPEMYVKASTICKWTFKLTRNLLIARR